MAVTIDAFLKALKGEKLPQVFLLAGEETYFIRRGTRALEAALAARGIAADAIERRPEATAAELAESLRSTGLFSTGTAVFTGGRLLGAGRGKKEKSRREEKEEAALLALIAAMPEGSYLVFTMAAKPDKRTRLYKAVSKAGLVLDAEPVRAYNIGPWLDGELRARGLRMTGDARSYFAGAVGVMKEISLEYLSGQFEKLSLYKGKGTIERRDLEDVFSALPEVSIFALSEAVSEKNARKAIALLRRNLADGVYFTLIISLLTRHVRQLWQAKLLAARGVRGRAIAKPLSLNPYIAERRGRAAARFQESTLKKAHLMLIEADYRMKVGKAGPELLEAAILTLCRKERGV